MLTALGFVMAHEEVDVAIVGTQSRQHLESNVEMVNSRLPLAPETVEALHERYNRHADTWQQRG